MLFLDKRNQLIARRGAAGRHRRSHAGLSARGGQTRAGAVRHRHRSWCTTIPLEPFRSRSITQNPSVNTAFVDLCLGDGLHCSKCDIEPHTAPSCRPLTDPRGPSVPSLTDGEIRQALERAEKLRKQISLTDGEGRGTGRLVLVMKPMPKRVTADWMAQQWRDGKRTKSKIGSYPSMSLAEAREIFKRDFADVIQKGRSIKIAGDTRPGTVADLFEAYVAASEGVGKIFLEGSRNGPQQVADTLGRNRPARDITPDDVSGSFGPSTSAASACDGRSCSQLHPVRLLVGA